MSFLARCPHCQRETVAPDDDLGRSVPCHGCRADFVLVPEFSAPPPPALWTPPDPSDESSARAEQFEPSPLAVMDPPAEPEPEPRPETRRRPIAEDSPGDGISPALWVLAGAVCLCAASAGVSASVTSLTGLVIPFALAGLLLGAVAVVQFVGRAAAPLELAVPGIPTAGSALVLLLALVAPDSLSPQYEASRQKSADDPNALRVVPLSGELIPPGTLGPADAGVDASRFALQRKGMRVRVTAVTVGPVRLEGKKVAYTKERYVAVDVVLQHVGGGEPVSAVPWGTSSPRVVPNVALKTGGTGVEPVDPGAAPVAGRWTGELHLPPGGAATARLLFPERPLTEPVTLELPAEAWGQAGVFRFRIPTAMVAAATAAKAK